MEASPLTTILLPAALFVIMLGLGLALTTKDFQRLLTQPKAVLAGLTVQILLLPLAGWLIVQSVPMAPALAVGLMALALCPGGPTATLVTHLSKGDTALSVTLTALTSVLTVVTVPLVLNPVAAALLPGSPNVVLPLAPTIVQLVLITLVPVAVGMLARAKTPAIAQKAEKPVKVASAVFLVLVILAAVLRERENLASYFAQVGAPMLALNLVAISLGYAAGKFLRLKPEESTCLAIDTAISNGTLAIFVTATLLANPAAAIPPAIYSLLMFVTASAIVAANNRRQPTPTSSSP